ncbi:MAG: carbonic anhydrase [Actinobacteria bacterium]|nr:carbonic anhydrase [Actinomycetota bacterium]
MSEIDVLLDQHRGARHDASSIPIMPRLSTVVVSCLDARVDPVHLFGLAPGDAVVLRNAGGRVDEAVLRDVSLLRVFTAAASGGSRSPELVVVHHTDCGTARLGDPTVASAVAGPVGADADAVAAMAVTDPWATVRHDVGVVRGRFPGQVAHGYVFDVATGELLTAAECETTA